MGIATAVMPFADRNMLKSVQNPALAATLVVIAFACSFGPSRKPELNMAFHFDRNQLVVDRLEIAGHTGRFIIGTAYPSTLVGSEFATRHDLPLSGPFRLIFRDVHVRTVDATVTDLGGEMDAIIGADLLSPVIVIDYRNRLLTRFPEKLAGDADLTHTWTRLPQFPLTINGQRHMGIIDTALPDTLMVPASLLRDRQCVRCEVDVELAGVQFDDLSILAADVEEIRIGNRLLEHFLVMIDYRGKTATLENW